MRVDNHRAAAADQQRVAITRRFGRKGGADHAAGAGSIVDHDLLTTRARATLGEQASDDVGALSGRERHDDAHGLARPFLGR